MLVHDQLRRFEGTIIRATKGGLTEMMNERFPRWSFSESLLYSLTLITTIGMYVCCLGLFIRFDIHFVLADYNLHTNLLKNIMCFIMSLLNVFVCNKYYANLHNNMAVTRALLNEGSPHDMALASRIKECTGATLSRNHSCTTLPSMMWM